MLWNDIADLQMVCTGSSNHNKRTGFNTVWNDFMEASAQCIDPIDGNDIGACSTDSGTHFVKQCSHIDNFRFLGSIFNCRTALGIYGRHHDIDGCSNRCNIKENLVSYQSIGSDVIASLLKPYLCTKGFKSFDVQINRARTKIASTRHSHTYMTIFSKQ